MLLRKKEADTSLITYEEKGAILPNTLLQICFGTLGTTFITVLSLDIQNLSLTLQQFQRF